MLERIDLTKRIEAEEYWKEVNSRQLRVRELLYRCQQQQVPVIAVFEGWDAAGKGGTIKRVTQKLDPRNYSVIPIAAPKGDEATHHYLWRFWRHIPRIGRLAIFDRSWYGRVMVERIEGFCTEDEWRRAFREINEFERQLVDYGSVVTKFWLHISKDEQLRRFKERAGNTYKQYKLTDEDWRNRKKWQAYWTAVNEMIEKTSTTWAPWTVVEANDKLWARVKTLSTLDKAISDRVGG